MLKDKTNQNLLGILIFLAVLYAGSYWLKKGSSGSTVFTKNLVHIDTAQITDISIERPGSRIELDRQNRNWLMTTEEGAEVSALNDRVANMLSSLVRLSPSRIITHDPAKWRDYQVDSTGERIQIFEGKNKTLDLIIGRGAMQGQRTFVTYVRPYEEDNVYVVENFSGSSVSANSANYRNKNILSAVVDSIHQLIFNYPADDDFTLSRMGDHWEINGVQTDSTKTVDYLKELRRITSASFVDRQRPAVDADPLSSLTIRSHGTEDVFIQLFDGPGGGQILHSSQNPENYFVDTAVVNKVFVGEEEFLKGGF